MKLIKNIKALFLIIIMLITFIPKNALAIDKELGGFNKVAETSSLILYLNNTTCEIAVKDKKNNNIWWSNPISRNDEKMTGKESVAVLSSQLTLEYVDEVGKSEFVNSFGPSVSKKNAKITKIDDGVRIDYNFPSMNFLVPVKYSIKDDYFKAEIIVPEIKEDGQYKIVNIGLLPYFGAGSIEDKGYMVVPDGCGAIINFNNNKPKVQDYKQYIYGKDAAREKSIDVLTLEKISMPIFGIKNGDSAFLAVVNKGESTGIINANVVGENRNYNKVFSQFEYRGRDQIRMSEKDFKGRQVQKIANEVSKIDSFEVRYYFLQNKESDYSNMATRYQKFLVEEKNVKSEKSKKMPFYLNLYGGVKVRKTFLGVPYYVTKPLTSYKEVNNIVSDLKNEGIENLVIKYSGWMKDGLRNEKIPTKVSFDKRLGGKKDFELLVKELKKENVELYPNADIVNFSKSGNGLSKLKDCVQSLAKKPAYQYKYSLSTGFPTMRFSPWYLLSPLKFQYVSENLSNSYKKNGIDGISLDPLDNMIYSDYSKKSIERGEVLKNWNESMGCFKNNVGKVMVSNPNAFSLSYADHALSIPLYSSSYDIFDETIPFYQIALSGIKNYSTPAVNLSSEQDVVFLKAVETGSSLLYDGTYEDTSSLKTTNYTQFYSTYYNSWKESAVEYNKKLSQVFSKIGGKKIVWHKKLQDNVFETKYEGNIRVIVNYNDKSIKQYGKEVNAKDYFVLDGE